MNDLTEYLGKYIRFEYSKNGQTHAVKGYLKTIQEDRCKVGDMWQPLVFGYKIKEVEYKGS